MQCNCITSMRCGLKVQSCIPVLGFSRFQLRYSTICWRQKATNKTILGNWRINGKLRSVYRSDIWHERSAFICMQETLRILQFIFRFANRINGTSSYLKNILLQWKQLAIHKYTIFGSKKAKTTFCMYKSKGQWVSKLLLLHFMADGKMRIDLLRGSIIGTFNEPRCAPNTDNDREFPVYFQLKYHHHNSNKVQLYFTIYIVLSLPFRPCDIPPTNPTQSHPHLVTLTASQISHNSRGRRTYFWLLFLCDLHHLHRWFLLQVIKFNDIYDDFRTK